MALTITHSFVSPKADGPDNTLVKPSDWNANHSLTGFPGDASLFLDGNGNFNPVDFSSLLNQSNTWNGYNSFNAVGSGAVFGVIAHATADGGETSEVLALSTGGGLTSGSTVDVFYGLYVNNLTSPPDATLTNIYGIYIQDQTNSIHTGLVYNFYSRGTGALNAFDGPVGFGESNPQTPVHVSHDTGAATQGVGIRLNSVSGSAGCGLGILWTDNEDVLQMAMVTGQDDDNWGGRLVFFTSPQTNASPGGTLTERMRITSAGNVAVGNNEDNVGAAFTSPSARFHVHTESDGTNGVANIAIIGDVYNRAQVSNVIGVKGAVTNGSILSNMFSLYAGSPTVDHGGTTINAYGLFVEDVTVGTDLNCSIRTGLGPAWITDKLWVGDQPVCDNAKMTVYQTMNATTNSSMIDIVAKTDGSQGDMTDVTALNVLPTAISNITGTLAGVYAKSRIWGATTNISSSILIDAPESGESTCNIHIGLEVRDQTTNGVATGGGQHNYNIYSKGASTKNVFEGSVDASSYLLNGQPFGGGTLSNLFTNTTPISVVGTVNTASGPHDVFVDQGIAYITETSNNTIGLYDVRNPTVNPSLITQLSTASQPHNLFVSGNVVYVTTQNGDNLDIFRVSDIDNTSRAASFGLGYSPRGIYVANGYAYITEWSNNAFHIIDVTVAETPVSLGSVAVGSGPHGVYANKTRAYVVSQNTSSFAIINISDPHSPQVITTVDLTANGDQKPFGIAVQNHLAFISCQNSNTVAVYDISNASAPVYKGSVAVCNNPHGIRAAGRYVYVIGQNDNNLSIIDALATGVPAVVTTFSIPNASQSVGLFVKGRHAYVVDQSNSILNVIDLTGVETNTLIAHSAEVGSLTVSSDAVVDGQLQVHNTLTLGNGLSSPEGLLISAPNVQIGSNVQIGITGALLQLFNTTDEVGLIVQANQSGQTADLMQWKAPNQSVISRLTSAGNLQSITQASAVNFVLADPSPQFDCSLGDIQFFPLTQDSTGNVFGHVAGQKITFIIHIDDNPPHNFTWPITVKGGMSVSSATANQFCIQEFISVNGGSLFALGPGMILS